jgi:hypothetical protein
MVPGASPLEALLVVHRDGLGPRRVRLVGGAFWFADTADRELCAGFWKRAALARSPSWPTPSGSIAPTFPHGPPHIARA